MVICCSVEVAGNVQGDSDVVEYVAIDKLEELGINKGTKCIKGNII